MALKSLKLRFIDSLNFLQSTLLKMPSIFFTKDEIKNMGLKKGDFLHKFNRPENFNYVGLYPDLKYYNADKYDESDRKEFIKWYLNKKYSKETFDFQKELKDYCKQDVNILKKCCEKFRETYIENTGCDPFSNITIAATCSNYYKNECLEKNTLIMDKRWDSERNSSYRAKIWLKYVANTNKVEILPEHKVLQYYADGYDPKTKTVYEYNGCYWHGCS